MSNVKIKLLILLIIKICASKQNENFKCVVEDGSCSNSSFPANLIGSRILNIFLTDFFIFFINYISDNFNVSSNQISFNSIFTSDTENFTISDVKYKKLVDNVAFVKAKNDTR